MSMSGPTTEFADDDRRTFGPTQANREVLEMLVNQGHFKTLLGAFQAAAMYALRKGLTPKETSSTAGTTWNRGSVNNQILDFLNWYLPTTTPVKAFADLGNLGTASIGDRVRTGGYSLTEIFEIPELEID